MAWLTNKTWASGRLLATDLNTYVRDQLNHIGGSWPAYSPALTASVTNPALGATGQAVGAAHTTGKTCRWRAAFSWAGAGASAGSGDYEVWLPATPTGTFPVLGQGYAYFGGSWYTVILDPLSGTKARLIAQGIGAIGSAQGAGAGAVLAVGGRYEIA